MGTKQWAIAAAAATAWIGSLAGLQPAWAQDQPTETRMFFSPTARTLPQGEGYIGVYSVMLPFVQVGATDAVTLGAAVPVLPYLLQVGMGGPREMPFVVSAKARLFHRPKTSVAAGAIHLAAPGEGNMGLAYVVGTNELDSGSVSLGAGCAYVTTDRGSRCRLNLTAGGDYRVSKRVTFVTENHVLIGQGVMIMGGARVTRGRVSTDFGAMVLVGSPLPGSLLWNVAYRFGGS